MIPALTLPDVLQQVTSTDSARERTVGLMMANYRTPTVRQLVGRAYAEWDLETAGRFDLFWLAYGLGLPFDYEKTAKQHIDLVNFNPALDAAAAPRFSQHRDAAGLADTFSKLENPKHIFFDLSAYTAAKNELRESIQALRLGPLTLILFHYTPKTPLPNKANTVLVNIFKLSEQQAFIENAVSLVSDITALCGDEKSFKNLKRKVNKKVSAASGPKMQFTPGIGLGDLISLLGMGLAAAGLS